MRASSVRELARRHAAGELSLVEYRAQRHALIDNITSGQQILNYEERVVHHRRTSFPSRLILLGSASIIAIIVIAVAIWAIGIRSVSRPKAPQAVSAPMQTTLPSPGPQLVGDFLRTNNWSTKHIQDFIRQWNDLPGKERELAHQDYHYPRLASELRQQIVSQQAMSELAGHGSATQAQLASLRNMASTLGIETDN